MNAKIGTFNFEVESSSCDFNGQLPLPYLFNLLLKASEKHADERHFGYNDLSKQNKAWVLSRMGMYMNKYPGYDTVIRIQTWVANIERFFTRRCFRISTADDTEIGYAQTLWAAIDLETRKPCNINELGSTINDYLGAEMDFPEKKLGKIAAINNQPVLLHKPAYSDIDINGHFNSARYIERILDLFDIEQFKEKSVREFEIQYLAEALPESRLSFHLQKNDKEYFTAEIKDHQKDISTCRAAVLFG
ncbi:MAG: acyl-[acyl-carrier-protein] thioesterase [Prevotellaceae bacterium]|jgi:acyl-ACP thioesterase|nr:acyl-[acyl-carrier-protein] thioesterase [Prevotellaceae bacterium]